jgi:pilus assembly protein CpaF
MVNGAGTTFIEVKGKIQRTGSASATVSNCSTSASASSARSAAASTIIAVCDARPRQLARQRHRAPLALTDSPHHPQVQEGQAHARPAREVLRYHKEGSDILRSSGVAASAPSCRAAPAQEDHAAQLPDAVHRRRRRIITCQDAAELQLQQPRGQTKPAANLEGEGQITMRDLVKNCLRMRPERIIVGEVRGPEAFDLLQAMNTGHDGSMGTLHANSPREALSRIESMITMGGYSLPSRTIREMVCGSVDMIVQAARLRDGSRRITHVTEVMGMEGDVIITQDIFLYDMTGEDADGNIIGKHRSTGIGRPKFWDRARYYGEEKRLAAALDAAESVNSQNT